MHKNKTKDKTLKYAVLRSKQLYDYINDAFESKFYLNILPNY